MKSFGRDTFFSKLFLLFLSRGYNNCIHYTIWFSSAAWNPGTFKMFYKYACDEQMLLAVYRKEKLSLLWLVAFQINALVINL